MALRDIISIPDPILREVSRPVERIDAALLKVMDDMLDTMYDAPGIGLAGIQIGLPLRVVVCDIGDPEDEAKYEALLADWEEAVVRAEAAGQDAPSRPKRPERNRKPVYLINPQIVATGGGPSVYEEGCLSIPDYFAEVERPAGCTVEYLDRKGNKQILEADGLMATCLQHEIDHLDGRLFIDHISKLKRDMVIRKFTKIARNSGKAPASPLVI